MNKKQTIQMCNLIKNTTMKDIIKAGGKSRPTTEGILKGDLKIKTNTVNEFIENVQSLFN